MTLYDSLPNDFLIQFYHEIKRNIESGIVSDSLYYELALLIAVALERGLDLEEPQGFERFIDRQILNALANGEN
ncbi:hypothetical protein AB1K84_24010 [Mesobacillus foraminis]|uniref:hypothetical protein n=1 Tax=Mesobacillus foraminis TaxID=279826 RepID=UPI0039A0D704